jgi:hypothetical protein
MKIGSVGAEFFHADERTDGETDMMSLTIAFAILRKRIKIISCRSVLPEMEQDDIASGWKSRRNVQAFSHSNADFQNCTQENVKSGPRNKRLLPASALYPQSDIPARPRSINSIVRYRKYLSPGENSCNIQ